MLTPIELVFNPGESLATTTTVAVVAGGVFGTFDIPFTPLEFTNEKVNAVLGAGFIDSNHRVNNEQFYKDRYSGLPFSFQQKFQGDTKTVSRKVYGVALQLNPGEAAKKLAEGVGKVLWKGAAVAGSAAAHAVNWFTKGSKPAVNIVTYEAFTRIFGHFFSKVNLPSLSSFQSGNALLYGMNGHDTYNQDINNFLGSDINVCAIGLSGAAFAQLGLSVVFFGPFSKGKGVTMVNGHLDSDRNSYLAQVNEKAYAYAIVKDAAIGFNLPGIQVQIVGS